jgi:peroxiredoxin Q/BCP
MVRRASSLLLGLAAALALAACSDPKRPDGGKGLLPVGAPAPDLVAKDPQLRPVRLSELRGHPVIVYFYPADGTPGCTKEACAFRDAWKKYDAAHVGIIGVSNDDQTQHAKFTKEHAIPFPLAADTDGTIGQSYGVGKKLWGYDRVSFLVDKDGKVAKVWPSVDPGVHADEVLAEATKLP